MDASINNYRPLMLPINEAAEMYGLSTYIMRKWALSGIVKAVRAGNKILINCNSLEEYLNSTSLYNDTVQAVKPISGKII